MASERGGMPADHTVGGDVKIYLWDTSNEIHGDVDEIHGDVDEIIHGVVSETSSHDFVSESPSSIRPVIKAIIDEIDVLCRSVSVVDNTYCGSITYACEDWGDR